MLCSSRSIYTSALVLCLLMLASACQPLDEDRLALTTLVASPETPFLKVTAPPASITPAAGAPVSTLGKPTTLASASSIPPVFNENTSDPPTPTFPGFAPATASTMNLLQIQQRLAELGYTEIGWIDGLFSDHTAAALRHFQMLNQLPVNGQLDEITYAALFNPSARRYYLPPAFPGAVICPGVSIDDDQALHSRLATLGYIAPGEEEWIMNRYGPVTQAAVRRFQKLSGLPANAEVDLKTWAALFSPWAVTSDGAPWTPRPTEMETAAIFPVGEHALALAFDGQHLWVAHSSSQSYLDIFSLGIDPYAREFEAPVILRLSDPRNHPEPVSGVLYAGGRLWFYYPNADDGEPPFLRSLNTDSGVLGQPLRLPKCPGGYCFPSSGFGFDGRRLWASVGDQVIGIDPSSNGLQGKHTLGWLAHGRMISDGRCMWVAGEAGLTAFNPNGGDCPAAELAYSMPNDALAFDGKRIWAASAAGGYLVSLDVRSGEISPPLEVGNQPQALAFDGQRLWIALGERSLLVGMDVESGVTGAPLRVGDNPVDILFDGARLWVLSAGSRTLQIVDPAGYSIPSPTPTLTDTPVPTWTQGPSPTATQTPTATLTPTVTSTPTPSATRTPAPPLLKRKLSLASPRMEGEDVLFLQQRLLALGYVDVGVSDGIFGPKTDQAVRHFQQANGLMIDGVVGPQTWAALFSSTAHTVTPLP